MRLERAFYRLPLGLDSPRLQWEVTRLLGARWLAHPTGYAGNSSLPLISVAGGANDDFAISGAMQATPALASSPYLRQVLAGLGVPVTRSRLMRLEPGSEVPWHDDRNFHWFKRMRFHVPIFTEPEVHFDCGEQTVHMAAGEVWTFDNFRRHRVRHGGRAPRIHLVADTRGSPSTLKLLESSDSAPRHCPFVPDAEVYPEIEPYEFEILRPQELRALLGELERDSQRAELTPQARSALGGAAELLAEQYSRTFEQQGPSPAAEWQFRRILDDFRRSFIRHAPDVQRISDAVAVLCSMFVTTNRRPNTHSSSSTSARPSPALAAAAPRLVRAHWFEVARSERYLDILPNGQLESVARIPAQLERVLEAFGAPCTEAEVRSRLAPGDEEAWRRDLAFLESLDLLTTAGAESLRFERPLIVVSAPRAGSTLLFELLAQLPHVLTVGGESHAIIEGIPALHPRSRGYASNALTAQDAPAWLSRVLRTRFGRALRDRDGVRATDSSETCVRLLEKTPKNALRIPFLDQLFPDALFVFLHREAPANLGSLMEGWRSGQFVTYPRLPGWRGMAWSFLLTPGWQALSPDSLAAIAAEQWVVSNTAILDALEALPRQRWLDIDYAELTGDPRGTYERIASWAELPVDARVLAGFAGDLPLSSFTLSLPARDKWKRYQTEIEAVLPGLAPTRQRLRSLGPARAAITSRER